MFYPAHECENELETTPTPVGVMKPRFAHFTIELNDSRWISEMVRWKATSKGFLTGHLQEPSGVIKPNRELRQSCCRVSQDGVCLKLERYLPSKKNFDMRHRPNEGAHTQVQTGIRLLSSCSSRTEQENSVATKIYDFASPEKRS